jgi:hypothetical protein
MLQLSKDQVAWASAFLAMHPDVLAGGLTLSSNGANAAANGATGETTGPANGTTAASGGNATANGAGATTNGKLPSPMTPECKVVHGKVPGPKNHLLCTAHNHVVDVDAKMIIAHSLDEYIKAHPRHHETHQSEGKHEGGATAGAKDQNNQAGTANASDAHHLAGANHAKGMATPDQVRAITETVQHANAQIQSAVDEGKRLAHDIETGKSLAMNKVEIFVTQKATRMSDMVASWQNEWENKLNQVEGDSGGIGAMLLNCLKIIKVAVSVAFPEVAAAVKIVDEAKKVANVAERAEKIAQLGEGIEKGLEALGTVSEIALEKQKKQMEKQYADDKATAIAHVKDLANQTRSMGDAFLVAGQVFAKAQLATLARDPDVSQKLASGEDKSIEFVVINRMGIKSVGMVTAELANMKKGLDAEMKKFVKDQAVNSKYNDIMRSPMGANMALIAAGGDAGINYWEEGAGDKMKAALRKKLEADYDEDHKDENAST